ncbi:MAG: hypothetical protein DBX37_00460 [Massilioclostridium sp.]|nr:MAG: hypothetical protein DBX37_00460 [Massilioclostridium sp.]
MAYTIKKTEAIGDTITIEAEQGNLEFSYNFVVTPELIKKFREIEVKKAVAEKDKTKQENIEIIGRCVVDLFNLFFGEENSKKIFDFYKADYISMCQDFVPYIYTVIIPKVQELSKRQKALVKKRFR